MAIKINKTWHVYPGDPGHGSLLDRLLAVRGFNNPDQVNRFLNPSLDRLYNPMLLNDMNRACLAIIEALNKKKHITVHGDYDVDGLTASALMIRFLRSLGADPDVLIPDRLSDGYGLSENAVDLLSQKPCDLLITVDCGIASRDEISRLNHMGIQVIVTDHHECIGPLPEAEAVINPKRSDSHYPFAELAGVGVALKLVQGLCQILNLGDQWKTYLDLVALGTVADVVPLIDENRWLVFAGLEQINQTRFLVNENRTNPFGHSTIKTGLRVLLDTITRKDRFVTSQVLGFSISPRLNAAGRMGDAVDALNLLLTDSETEAQKLTQILMDLNSQRQNIENAITEEAMKRIDSQLNEQNERILVVSDPDWHPGVIGIVASRLAEHYARPVMVLTGDGSSYRGSCRSWGSIDILAVLKYVSPVLERFGGHVKAAGLTVSKTRLAEFRLAVRHYAEERIKDTDLQTSERADLIVAADDLTLDQALKLRQLEPYGEQNPEPRFICRGLIVREIQRVGDGRHVKIRLADPEEQNTWDGIIFGAGDLDEWIGVGDGVDILGFLQVNEWQGKQTPQLNIQDIHPANRGDLFYDQPWEVERYYCSNGSISQLMRQYDQPMEAFLPKKKEYKAVYQYLRAHHDPSEPFLVDVPILARKISRSYRITLHPFRLARILSVFHETQLIHQQQLTLDRLRLTLLPVNRRVRLDRAPTYRRLYREMEGGDLL